MRPRLALVPWLCLLVGAAGCLRLGYGEDGLDTRTLDAAPGDTGPDQLVSSPDGSARDAPIGPDQAPADLIADWSPDLAVSPDATTAPDLSCGPAVSQTSTSGGYLMVYTARTFAQAFTAPSTGVLREVHVMVQVLNGGETSPLWLGVMATQGGTPGGAALAERPIGPLVPGWKTYIVDFSPAKLGLQAGTTYALRVRSEAVQTLRHTLAFGASSGGGVKDLWVQETAGWLPAPSVISILNSTHVIYFVVVSCS